MKRTVKQRSKRYYLVIRGIAIFVCFGAGGILQGCSVAPIICFMNYDHVSHPLLGVPFGPETEEGTIDSIGTTCRWDHGRVFLESGLSYMIPDSDLYGDDFLFNSRIAVKIWER